MIYLTKRVASIAIRRCAGTVLLIASLHGLAEPIPVVASFSILGNLVEVVGGEKVAVKTLVGTDGDAHVYQPSPQDVKAVAGAKLLVMNGLDFEGWMTRLVRTSRYKGVVVTAGADLPLNQMAPLSGHNGMDPHAWQDPNLARIYVKNIAKGLAKVDPNHTAYYLQRAGEFDKSLAGLDIWASNDINTIKPNKRRVITSHDAFGYLGRRYGISFLAPQGMNTDSEASAKAVGALIQQAKRERIKAIFVENISNPKLIEQISKETGAILGPRLYSDALSTADGPAGDYLSMMRYNIHALVTAMKQN